MKRELNQNISGNKVYHTNSSILLVKSMLCSKIHHQNDFKSIPFSHKISEAEHPYLIRRDPPISLRYCLLQGLWIMHFRV